MAQDFKTLKSLTYWFCSPWFFYWKNLSIKKLVECKLTIIVKWKVIKIEHFIGIFGKFVPMSVEMEQLVTTWWLVCMITKTHLDINYWFILQVEIISTYKFNIYFFLGLGFGFDEVTNIIIMMFWEYVEWGRLGFFLDYIY